MTHFGADVTLLPSEAKPNFFTLAKVDTVKKISFSNLKFIAIVRRKCFAIGTPSCDVHQPVLKKAFANDNFLPSQLLPE